MHIDDLTPIFDRSGKPVPNAVAIGWLDRAHRFAVGPTPADFRKRLRRFCEQPVRKARGFHLCPFCAEKPDRGNGEIHVRGPDAQVFVAPALIAHYVDVHNYQPPEAFVRALCLLVKIETNGRAYGLSALIVALADDPTSSNRDAFYTAFAASRVARVSLLS